MTATTETVLAAAELLIDSQFGSPGMLQRRLRLTYATTQQVLAVLEQHGVIGPAEGTVERDVLVQPEEKTAVLEQLSEALA